MAFAKVQGVAGTNSSSVSFTTYSFTFGSAVTSGNTVMGVGQYDNGPGATITSIVDDKSNTYTVVDNILDTTDGQRSYSFYRANITNAPTTVTVTLSASSAFGGVNGEEWSGIATTSALVGHTAQWVSSKSTATDAMTSGTMTPTVNGALIWGASVTTDSVNTVVHGTGFTAGTAGPSGGPMLFESLTQATAASIAATFTAGVGSMQNVFVMAFAPTSSSVSVNLTGVNGTGSVGTFGFRKFASVAGTGAVGSIIKAFAIQLTGVSGTGASGTISRTVFLGSFGTGAVGSFTRSMTEALSGNSGTGAIGSLQQQFFKSVSGTGAIGTLVKQVTRALTGVSGSSAAGTLQRPPVSTTLTGVVGFGGVNKFHQFDPVQLRGIYQLVTLKPNTTYTLSARAAIVTAAAPSPSPTPAPSPSPAPSGAATMTGTVSSPASGPAKTGFALVKNYAFGSGSNTDINGRTVTTRTTLDSIAAKRYIYGTGDNQDGRDGLSVYWSRHRDYPAGDPKDLHVISSDHVTLGSVIPTTAAGYDINGGLFQYGIYSGILRFTDSLDMTQHWYIEGRIQVTTNYGAWPAFWLNPDVGTDGSMPWPPEIDIFEFFNWQGRNKSQRVTSNVHDDGASGSATYGPTAVIYSDTNVNSNGEYNIDGSGSGARDYGLAYHIYALEWNPNAASENAIIYIDGVKVRSYTYKWPVANKANIICGNQIGINWATPPGPNTGGSDGMTTGQFPMNYLIDYLRVYQV